ncbi:SgcJ/EcaC family oxidoreductase [Nocardia altamirensis]|uniref:SgcJ/EcaC family oxidoreductase n=1 Tax=Nocardia altamirensis TaxID=472158 RepID=UPI0008402CD5|nr:SgcJ/EcaC family oxidoreductase [Nocardia altamirensis]
MSIIDIDTQTRAADLAAFQQIIDTVEHAQNNELIDEFLALFRADAIWTTGGGKRLFGRDAIAEFTRQVLPGGMQGLSVTFELEYVLYLRPDVAAVKVRQIYHTPEGKDIGTPMWVMTKEDGTWKLAAAQNTGAPADEIADDAGRPIFGAAH